MATPSTRTLPLAVGLFVLAAGCGDASGSKTAPSAGHGTTTGEGGSSSSAGGHGGEMPDGGGDGGHGSATGAGGGHGTGGAAHAGGAGQGGAAGGGGAGGATGHGGAGGGAAKDAGPPDGAAPDGGVSCASPVWADSPPLGGATLASAAEDHASSSYLVTTSGIARYDAAGTLVWSKNFDPGAVAHRVLVDGNDDPIVIGTFTGTVSFGGAPLTTAGKADVFVAKLSPNGNAQWAVGAGGPDDDDVNDLAVDAAGDVVLGGSFAASGAAFGLTQLASAGGRDVFVAKLDPSGTLLWAKVFGGTGDDYTFGLACDGDGDVVGGMYSTSPSVTFGATTLMAGAHEEAIVYRLQPSGAPAWARAAGGDADAWVSGISMDKAGNAYVAGMFGGTATFDFDHGVTLTAESGTEAFLASYLPGGAAAWVARVGHGTLDRALQNDSAGDTVSVDPDGNATVVGWFSGTASFGPSGGGVGAKSAGGTDAFIARFDAKGKLVCLIAGGGPGDDAAQGVAADGIGGVVVSGTFDTTATIAGLPLAGNAGPSAFGLKLTQ